MSEAEDLMKNGFSLIDKGKYLDGLRELSKLEPQFQSKNNEEAADLFLGISQAYYGMTPSNDENSLKYADLAIEIHKKLGITPMVISDLLYSSFIEADAGKIPDAEKRIDQAIELARSSKDLEELPELLNSKADLLSTIKKRRKESAALFIEASKAANDSGNPQAYFHSRTGLIKLKRLDGLDSEKALDEAMKVIEEAESLAAQIKNKKERKDFIDDISEIYDIATDLAMEMEKVDLAISIAERMTKAQSK